ncbi:MAG: helix-turn-helix domain-containing protein [Pseudomonadota bacterium]
MSGSVTDQLSALAHERRLDIFRLLMRRYPDAVPAGEIAQALDLRPNTTSVYLSALRQANLVSQTRRGTFQLYRIRMEAVQGLFGDMLGACCRNRPDICMPWDMTRPRDLNARPFEVLFLCSHNSARSIMAEALLRASGPLFHAHSAGTHPAGTPHPAALQVLGAHGIEVSGLQAKAVADHLRDAPAIDLVITVCNRAAHEDLYDWPGSPLHAHWGLPDPLDDPDHTEAAMRRVFDMLRPRIQALAALPLADLDAPGLQSALDDIGRWPIPDMPTH